MNGEHPGRAAAETHTQLTHAPFRSPLLLRNAVLAVTAVNVLLCVLAATQILHILELFGQVAAGGVSDTWRTDLQESGRRQLLLDGIQTLTFLAICGLGAGWIHRAAGNVRALGARGLSDSPAWAVAWYVIPFANLVRPFRAMQEIWGASLSPARWERLGTHPLLAAWWATFVVTAVYGSFAVASQSVSGTVYALHTQELMVLWLQPLSATASVLFAAVVFRVTRMQLEAHARQAPATLHGMPAMA